MNEVNATPVIAGTPAIGRYLGVQVLLLLALLGAGCGGPPALSPGAYIRVPGVDLAALRARVAHGDRQLMQAELLVHNPNPFELALMGIDVELGVDGRRLARGLSNEPVRIPARGAARVTVSMSLTARELARLQRGLQRRQNAGGTGWTAYSVNGLLFLGEDNGISSIPFAQVARMELR